MGYQSQALSRCFWSRRNRIILLLPSGHQQSSFLPSSFFHQWGCPVFIVTGLFSCFHLYQYQIVNVFHHCHHHHITHNHHTYYISMLLEYRFPINTSSSEYLTATTEGSPHYHAGPPTTYHIPQSGGERRKGVVVAGEKEGWARPNGWHKAGTGGGGLR